MSEIIKLTEEQQKKFAVWGNFGLNLNKLHQEHALVASKAVKDNPKPESIKDIEKGEEGLKLVKAAIKQLSTNRIAQTEKLNTFLSKLIDPEKELKEHQAVLEAALINLKRMRDEEAARLRKIEEAKIECKAHYNRELIRITTHCQNKVAELVNRVYEFCLNEDVKPSEISEKLPALIANVTELSFMVDVNNFQAGIVTSEFISQCRADAFSDFDYLTFVLDFQNKAKEKFEDYEIAYINKSAAIERAKKEKAEAEAKAKREAEAASLVVNIHAKVEAQPQVEYKGLKKSFEVDMDETPEAAAIILTAFFANIDLCKKKTTVKNWFNFSVSNAITALNKVKNEDDSFAFTGLKFKEVDKL